MSRTTVLLLCQLLVSLSVGWGLSVISDAGPNEFPYVVKLTIRGLPYSYTEAAVVVSKKYIISSGGFSSIAPANMSVTDQSGKVRPVARVQPIVSDNFSSLKVCEKFRGATMPMTASSFNDLSADVNSTAFLLLFNASSHVLRKLPASVMKTASCPAADGGKYICTYQDFTPGYCSFLSDSETTPTYDNWALITIGSQVQGYLYSIYCDFSTGTVNDTWLFNNYGYYRQSIIAEIPEVDIK
ncbi:uncharacterized protein LOC135934665 [Cloeon dipterum]|uniref:uncharacterized protein LOC135934665 n=1 Tax=Cloeon dipterum TaxID=197152 RepID=UPI00321F6316